MHNTISDQHFFLDKFGTPTRGITDSDYQFAASALGIEIAAIKAVAQVETKGDAFDKIGRPRILFERHYFHRLTHGRYDKSHPELSNPRPGGYGKFCVQYNKLRTASRLNATAAVKSCSWGKFQIMGIYFKEAGYSSAQDFAQSMRVSEAARLGAFVKFIASNAHLLLHLKAKNWPQFARGYNGANYRTNSYDSKLEAAFKGFQAAKIPGNP